MLCARPLLYLWVFLLVLFGLDWFCDARVLLASMVVLHYLQAGVPQVVVKECPPINILFSVELPKEPEPEPEQEADAEAGYCPDSEDDEDFDDDDDDDEDCPTPTPSENNWDGCVTQTLQEVWGNIPIPEIIVAE